ncbi:hypothetical protein J7T55_005539 [Diaporthe amygdali]|uniref:uncharacterized protein n=1 Tax=Phomopsis amygdali TaxID=1214568 RepID=UPI0022FE479B|nr:uncharacterized protein J7T55_005539 [Diaporthe amygdali]KAJ0108991.1 hypothetical protein J7T55_005539 [Diaporthe amygdali]
MDNDNQQADQGSRPRRLRQKDLEELREKHDNGEDKLIPIWQRAGPKEPLTLVIQGFSRSALMTFSPVWKKELEANPSSLVLRGPHLGVYKLILDWINLCIAEGNDVKFPDIEEPENEPEEHGLDYERPHQLHVLLQIIAAANHLEIPEASLQTGLKKRAPGHARKHVISLDFVERIYSEENYAEYTDDLREIAAISIFEAWWTFKLDGPESDQYISWLEQMRVDYPQLDADLHQQFDKKKEFIESKREERRRARDAEVSAPSAENGFDNPGDPIATGGWDSVDGAGGADGDGWNQAAAMLTTEGGADWDKATEEAPSWAAPATSIW